MPVYVHVYLCAAPVIFPLYIQPTARIRANGLLSDTLKNGTRQGCPLSPILFSIYLEPFLSTVRLNPNIHGVKVKEKEHKLAAYAGDVLFYVQQPRIKLPNLLQLMQEFQTISNFTTLEQETMMMAVPQEYGSGDGVWPPAQCATPHPNTMSPQDRWNRSSLQAAA